MADTDKIKSFEQAECLKSGWTTLSRSDKAALVSQIVDAGTKRQHLADYLGVHHSAVDRLYWNQVEEPEEKQPSSEGNCHEKVSETADSLTVDLRFRGERIKNIEQLVAHCKIDTAVWEVIEFTANKWEVGAAQKSKSVYLKGKKNNTYIGYEVGDCKIVVEPLFQVKARFRKKVALVSARAELEQMKKDWRATAPVYSPVILADRLRENMLEVVIIDQHMGKLAWAKETRHDYDLKIAEQMHDEAVEVNIERAKGYGLAQIVYVVGNDLLHFDNLENATTHGTVVTADSRFQKVYKTTRQMITRAAEKFRKVAPVVIKIVPGNHDTVSSFTLGDALEVQFANCPDVVVDNSPRMRKYLQFGNNMIMWAHGNKGKLEQYPLLMATEEPKMWGNTVFREAHTGDKHQRKLIELHGVAVRILPTLCAPDDWHAENMFVGNIRSSESYVWNREQGLIGTIVHNLPAKDQVGDAA